MIFLNYITTKKVSKKTSQESTVLNHIFTAFCIN